MLGLFYNRSKSSSGVSGVNKLDGSFEPAASDSGMGHRNELDGTSLPRDRTANLEQRVVAKGGNKYDLSSCSALEFYSLIY